MFRAGAAATVLEPPLGLPMVGFVRQPRAALGRGLPLEVTAVVLERGPARAVLCGVDLAGIGGEEAAELVDRVAAATGAPPAGVVLNWSHTHLAPPGGRLGGALYGEPEPSLALEIERYAEVVRTTIVAACAAAASRLEEARPVWGQADVDEAVNRRERTPDGSNGGTILGWNPEGLVDREVTTLQLRRPDESVLATVVGFGCHPVTTGYDMDVYSADFPGPLRRVVRAVTGGECVFLQGAAGNVLPRVAFTNDEREAERMGTRIAVAALESVAGRWSTPVELDVLAEGSVTRIAAYRRRAVATDAAALGSVSRLVTIPLRPPPTLDDVRQQRAGYENELAAARLADDPGAMQGRLVPRAWGLTVEAGLVAGTTPTAVTTPMHAIRIGDGAIVTCAGEAFSEFGLAVKERAPGRPTFLAGTTNGYAGYWPTAAEYPFGGYEAGYGYKTAGLPSLYDPEVETICVSSAVRLAEELFPGAEPWDATAGWGASGRTPRLPPPPALQHPSNRTG